MHRIAIPALAAVMLLPAGAYAGIEVTDLPPRVDYVCAKNKQFSVDRSGGPRSATIEANGKRIDLPRVNSAAQEKYSDGDYTLYLDGEVAMLEFQSRVIYGPCKSAAPLPTYTREVP